MDTTAWIQLMLEEIERKRRDAAEARVESARRDQEASQFKSTHRSQSR
jgi:hypothetical protein